MKAEVEVVGCWADEEEGTVGQGKLNGLLGSVPAEKAVCGFSCPSWDTEELPPKYKHGSEE